MFVALTITVTNQAAFAGLDSGVAAYWDERYETALKELLPLAKSGETKAQFFVGKMYGKGLGVKRDYAEAAKWLHLAAEKGLAESQYYLSLLYEEGNGVEQDLKKSVKWLLLAAENGHADSQYYMGLMYQEGDGVEQNGEEAVKWYRKAAMQDHAYATYNLGLMFLEGVLIQKDEPLGIINIRTAHDIGLVEATDALAIIYWKGVGVEKDINRALKLSLAAATKGFPQSMSMVASILAIYEKPQSMVWFALALKAHELSSDQYKLDPKMYEVVKKTMDELYAQMTEEKIAAFHRDVEKKKHIYESAALLGKDD